MNYHAKPCSVSVRFKTKGQNDVKSFQISHDNYVAENHPTSTCIAHEQITKVVSETCFIKI